MLSTEKTARIIYNLWRAGASPAFIRLLVEMNRLPEYTIPRPERLRQYEIPRK